MADKKPLDILRQGVDIWNQWREEHTSIIQPNLGDADLTHADLIGANLTRSWLFRANLTGAHLNEADLSEAALFAAHLPSAMLRAANLFRADLRGANFNGARLSGANLSEARIGSTSFGNVDLSAVKGLETVKHEGPSTIGIDTIIKSHGHIPEVFLRNAGMPQSIIELIPSLTGSLKPNDYYSCFISYTSINQEFADRIYTDLQSKGVRCWFAPHDMRIGDKIRPALMNRFSFTISCYWCLQDIQLLANGSSMK